MAANPEMSGIEGIGARIKRLRLERGLSQRELSERGVSYAYISRIEAGARTPSVKALRMLARRLGVSVEYLETGSDLRDVDTRELRLGEAELALRLGEDTAAAEKTLLELVQEARAAGDAPSLVRARLALGTAAAQRGKHLDAVEQLESAIEEEMVRPQSRPDIYGTLGQSYAALGAPERAVKLFERCLAEIERDQPQNWAARIWFATLLSYSLTDSGDYDRARDVIRKELAQAGEVDAYSRIRLLWSLARLAHIEGRSAEALENVREAVALVKTTDDDVQLARAYLLSAGVESREGNANAAAEQLAKASVLFGTSLQPIDRAMLLIGDSRVKSLRGDASTAVSSAREAIDLLDDQHGGEQGTAVWALASGLALSGDVTGADDSFRRALDLLSVHGRKHDAAQVAGEWGRLLREQGRDEEAAKVLERAAGLGPELETAPAAR